MRQQNTLMKKSADNIVYDTVLDVIDPMSTERNMVCLNPPIRVAIISTDRSGKPAIFFPGNQDSNYATLLLKLGQVPEVNAIFLVLLEIIYG